jgi:virulence factor Mce-like protein
MNRNTGRLLLEVRRSWGGLVALAVLVAMTLGAAIVLVGGLQISLPWDDTYTVRVAVNDAKGVVAGKQQVRISGFPVGKITGLQLVDGRPVLTLTIDGRYAPLYRDAQLRMRPKTPLDDLYLDIESRGNRSAGRLSGDQILPAQRTVVPVDIGRVLDAFDAPTRVRLKQTIDGIGSGLADHGQDFRAALVELAPFLNAARRLTVELAQRRIATARLVHNLKLLTEALGSRDAQLRQLVTGGAHTFGQLASVQPQLARVIDELPPTLSQLLPTFAALRATEDRLDPALDALQPTAAALPSALGALRRFSVQATPALTALRHTLPDLRALVAALEPTSMGLNRDFSLLEPQAPRLDRITAKVVPCELAVDKFFNNTLSLTKFSDTGGVIVRGQTVNGLDPNQRAGRSCAGGGSPR